MTLSAPTLLSGSSSSTDSAAYTTASTNPAAGALFLVYVLSGKSAGGALAPTSVVHGNIGALTKVTEESIPNSNVVVSVWKGVGTGTGGTTVITHGVGMENCCWQLVSYTSDVATPTVRRFASAATAASGLLTASMTGGASLSTSCTVGILGVNSTTDAPTVGSGFTGLGTKLNQTSPVTALWSEYDNTSPPSSAGFTFTATTGKLVIALEVADGVAPAGVTLKVWNGTAEVTAALTVWNGTAEVPATLELAP